MSHDPLVTLSLECRRLFLRDHEVQVHIGAHDFEKGVSQRLIFNVELFVNYSQSTPQADQLAEVVNTLHNGRNKGTVPAKLAVLTMTSGLPAKRWHRSMDSLARSLGNWPSNSGGQLAARAALPMAIRTGTASQRICMLCVL